LHLLFLESLNFRDSLNKQKCIHATPAFYRFFMLIFSALNIALFWDVKPCGLVESYLSFVGTYCLHLQDWRWVLRNLLKFVPGYTASRGRWYSIQAWTLKTCRWICISDVLYYTKLWVTINKFKQPYQHAENK
jgi:hypothetical protein